MNQIYETETKGKYQMLIGKTAHMWREGKTPEEISEAINQSVDKVKECIEYCKVADDKKYHNKSKNCTGCKFNKDKDTCSNPNDCDLDENKFYTGYIYGKVDE